MRKYFSQAIQVAYKARADQLLLEDDLKELEAANTKRAQ